MKGGRGGAGRDFDQGWRVKINLVVRDGWQCEACCVSIYLCSSCWVWPWCPAHREEERGNGNRKLTGRAPVRKLHLKSFHLGRTAMMGGFRNGRWKKNDFLFLNWMCVHILCLFKTVSNFLWNESSGLCGKYFGCTDGGFLANRQFWYLSNLTFWLQFWKLLNFLFKIASQITSPSSVNTESIHDAQKSILVWFIAM